MNCSLEMLQILNFFIKVKLVKEICLTLLIKNNYNIGKIRCIKILFYNISALFSKQKKKNLILKLFIKLFKIL